MDKLNLSIPRFQYLLNFLENDFEFRVLDLEIAGELFDHQIRIHSELYLGRAELDPATDPMERPLVLRLIIGRDSEVLMPSLDGLPIFIRNKNPDSRRTRVEARSAVSVDEKFHVLEFRCITLSYSPLHSQFPKPPS